MEELLKKKYKNVLYDGEITGSEWYQMLQIIRKNEALCQMTIQDINRDAKYGGLTIWLKDHEAKDYVVFRGTAKKEWKDNFEGGYVSDTLLQKKALAYVEALEAEDITVVGHSKGGNKAKYTAILSDKVSRCVSFDGQGFSSEFLDKYWDLISKNKDKITCYALDKDFVNILMFDVYGKKYYVAGNGVGKAFAQNHSPNSFFFYEKETDMFSFQIVTQSREIRNLHFFVNYVLMHTEKKEKQKILDFLGEVADLTFGKEKEEKNTKDMIAFLLAPKQKEAVSILLAYVLQYQEDTGEIIESLCYILKEMKLDLIANIMVYLDKKKGVEQLIKLGTSVGSWVSDIFGWLTKEQISLLDEIFMDAIEKKSNIKVPNYKKREYKPTLEGNTIRDYGEDMYEFFLMIAKEIGEEPFYDVFKWNRIYELETWFSRLSISQSQVTISEYYKAVFKMNQYCEQQIKEIFTKVKELEGDFCLKIEINIQKLQEISKYFTTM